jgi:hypothetical protein
MNLRGLRTFVILLLLFYGTIAAIIALTTWIGG